MDEGIIAASLLILLITRQISDSMESELAKRFSRYVTPIMIPFALVFVFVVVEKVREL